MIILLGQRTNNLQTSIYLLLLLALWNIDWFTPVTSLLYYCITAEARVMCEPNTFPNPWVQREKLPCDQWAVEV